MRLVTANIGRKQSVQHTRSDFVTIKNLKGIVGFQEIDEADRPDEHALLKAVMGSTNTLVGMEHYVPIAVPNSQYSIVASHVIFGTGGVKHYTPNRYFTVVVLRPKGSIIDKVRGRTFNTFAVINTHYPAGGYHGNRPPAAKKVLKDHWDEQFAVHKQLIKHYADKGMTVFWTGDVNRMEMPKVHPREVQVVTVGIDSVSYVEGNIGVKLLGRGHGDLYSDHNAQYADFKLAYK